jgi:hypothetical protein
VFGRAGGARSDGDSALKHQAVSAKDPRRADQAEQDARALIALVAQKRLERGDIAITCPGKRDGVGSQAVDRISGMVLARHLGCRYLHSPFTKVAHHLGTPQEWAQRWESFLGMGEGESTVAQDAERVRLRQLVRAPEAYRGRPIVVSEPQFRLPRRAVAPALEALRYDLRTRYWGHGKASIPLHAGTAGSVTVAVHVRRGDVTPTSWTERYIPDEAVLRAVARLRAALAPFGRPLHINIYSEGTREQFRAYAAQGCHLHIDDDPFETFHNLVAADILLAGRSKFSRVAGLLSTGIVVSPSAYWSGLSHWVRRRRDGELSVAGLRRAGLVRAGWAERGLLCARLCSHWFAARSG